MTNMHDLTRSWEAVQGLAPELLTPITDDLTLGQVTRALRTLSREIQQQTSGPHPLDSLVELVSQRIVTYEAERWPVEEGDGASVLNFLKGQHHLTQQQLADATGIKQETISALLRRKRKFTAEQARKFAEYFRVNVGSFL